MNSKPKVLKKLYLSFSIVAAVLVAIIVLTYVNFSRVDEANKWRVHTYEVLAEIDGMSEGLLSTTRSARSYALTGGPQFYRSFVAADLDYDTHFSLAQKLTRDNPTQQRRLQRLQQQHERWRDNLIKPLLALRGSTPAGSSGLGITRLRNDKAAAVARLTLTQEYLIDQQSATLSMLENVEKTLLSQREATGARQQRLFEWTLIVAATLLILLTAVFTKLLAGNTWQIFAANAQLHAEIDEREKVQQELTARQQFLNALLDNMNAGVIACDAQGAPTLFNRATREFHGLPINGDVQDGRILAKDLYLPDGKTPLDSEDTPLMKAFRGELVRDAEVLVKPAQGEARVLEANAQAITDEKGHKMGAVLVMHDITERKRAEEEMHNTLRHARCILWYADIVERTDVPHGQTAAYHWEMRIADEEAAQHVLPLDVAPGTTWHDAWGQSRHPEDRERINAASLQALELRKPYYQQEYRCIDRNGEVRWLHEEVSLQQLQPGRWRAVGFCTDVTERRRAVEALRESEERFDLAQRGSNDGIWDWDLRTNEVYFSSRWKGMLGYEEHEVRNHLDEWKRLMHADDLERAIATVESYLKGKTASYELEHRLLHKDGSYRWILARGFAQRDYSGVPYRIVGSHLDLTERKNTEATLRANEEQLRQIFENASDIIYTTDAEGHFTFFNPTSLHIMRRTPEEIYGLRFIELIHPDYRAAAERFYGRQFVRKIPDSYYEYPAVAGDNSLIWFGQNVHLLLEDGKVVGFQAVARDITDRKRAENALAESEQRYRTVVDSIREVIFQTDATGKWTFLNPAWTEITGFTLEESLGVNYLTYVHPDERARNTELFAPLIAREKEECRHEVRYLTKDGDFRWIEVYARLTLDAAGEIVGTSGTLRDVTDRRRAEAELAESEERFRRLSEGAFEGIALSEQGIVIDTNSKFAEMFGYEVDELRQFPALQLVAPECYAQVSRAIATNSELRYESIGVRKDGSTFPIEVLGKVIPYQGRLARITAVRDITERKEVERMKSEFVSTVSHELRTPLTSIRGALGLVVGGIAGELPVRARSMIDIAHKNSERLVRLINDILDIEKIESGKMTLEMQITPLMPLIENAMEANRAYAQGFGVHFVLQSAVSDAQVNADSDRLIQVLTNLLSNAAKFSPHGGEVTVSVERMSSGLRVSVHDQGSGIPEEFKNRIFGKFAQADSSDTRQKGGTGLGLSISKAIVEKMGGNIGFYSASEQGTTFFFELPEHAAQKQEQVSTRIESRLPSILICEDDQDVAALLNLMLQQDGFSTRLAHTIDEARQLLRDEHFDGMTLDLMLPDSDGISFLRELRFDPRTRDLPVVVVSAHAEQGLQELKGEALGVADWLDKPIDGERLVMAVAHAASRRLPNSGKPCILHVEDDRDVIRVVEQILHDDADISAATDVGQALRLLQQQSFDLVLLDMAMPDGSGVEVLGYLHEQAPRVPVVIFSAREWRQETARHIGAALVKSRTSNEELLATIKSLLGSRKNQDAPINGVSQKDGTKHNKESAHNL
jgi:PAS domain S-box-containing protein